MKQFDCVDYPANAILKTGKITGDMITLLGKWRNSGFNVYAGPRILPPKANAPPAGVISTYDESPAPSIDDFIIDPDYPFGAYF